MLTYPNQEAVSTRDLAWNATGTSENLADGPMTATEALEKSGLAGWNVRKVPMSTALGEHAGAFEDAGLIVPDQYANVATIGGQPKVLGVVGSRYKNFQSEQTADMLDTIVDEGGAHFVAGGSLSDHRKTFMVMKMPEGLLVGGEDRSDLYLGVTNSFDGSGSLVAWVTAMRLRCTNMLNSAVAGAISKWRLRHTSGIEGKVEDARRSLQLTWKWTEEFNGQLEQLLDSPFTPNAFDKLVDDLAPKSESEHEGWVKRQEDKRGTLRYLFNEADTQEFGRGTKYAAYNAFAEYADWYMPVKGDSDGSKRAARTMDSATVFNFKQNALDALLTPA